MSKHSYSRCWLHLIWTTLDREPILDRRSGAKASRFLSNYAEEKGIYMKINYFNPEHVHTLIDLPTNKCIEEVIQLFNVALDKRREVITWKVRLGARLWSVFGFTLRC